MAEHFAGVPVHLLADAGPPFADDAVLTPALQQCWLDRWGLAGALPPPDACPDCWTTAADGRYDGLEHLLPHYAAAYPRSAFGLVAAEVDPDLRRGLALAACAETDPVSVPRYRRALLALRDSLGRAPNVGTYVFPGVGHTITDLAPFPRVAVGGERLTDWVARLAGGAVEDISE